MLPKKLKFKSIEAAIVVHKKPTTIIAQEKSRHIYVYAIITISSLLLMYRSHTPFLSINNHAKNCIINQTYFHNLGSDKLK